VVLLLLLTTHSLVRGYTRNNAALTTVPSDIPTTDTIINLNSNDFISIPANAFSSFAELVKCYLNENKISSVHPSAFQSTKLSELYMINNKLTRVPDFSAVAATLAVLNFNQNDLPNLASNHDWGAFGFLKKIEIDSNPSLTSIAALKNKCPALRYFSMAFTSLRDEAGVFETCPILYTVLWKDVPGAGNFDCPLPSSINGLYLGNRDMLDFPDFSALGKTVIPNLDLSGNVNITSIPATRVENLAISDLKLDRVGFPYLEYLHPMASTINHLSFKFNAAKLTNTSMDPFVNLRTLKLSGNFLTKFPYLGEAAGTIEELHLDINSISHFAEEDLEPLKSLKILNLERTGIKGDWGSLKYVADTLQSLTLSEASCLVSAFLSNMTQLTELILRSMTPLDCLNEVLIFSA
jgi:Leucine-rich repeat (LRR) protein